MDWKKNKPNTLRNSEKVIDSTVWASPQYFISVFMGPIGNNVKLVLYLYTGYCCLDKLGCKNYFNIESHAIHFVGAFENKYISSICFYSYLSLLELVWQRLEMKTTLNKKLSYLLSYLLFLGTNLGVRRTLIFFFFISLLFLISQWKKICSC